MARIMFYRLQIMFWKFVKMFCDLYEHVYAAIMLSKALYLIFWGIE